MITHKGYKIRLYPNVAQAELIDLTISHCRFLYNQMLQERIEVYEKLKDDKEALYKYKYKTEKEYKEEFPFLKDVSSRALQQSRIDLINAYKNFYRRVKQGVKEVGFPQYRSKKKDKWAYREPQVGTAIRIKDSHICLLKVGWIKFRGLAKNFNGRILNVTVEKTRSEEYYASICVEQDSDDNKKERKTDNIIGIDLGLKEFAVCSNGEIISGIKEPMKALDNNIRKQQKHLSRKEKGSNRWNNCRIKLNRLYQKRQNFLNHFQWHLANKLCSENSVISMEDLNVSGMKKNRKLSRAIHNVNWSSFTNKLAQKAVEYGTTIFKIPRFFPSSKMCSNCGSIKEDLTLSDRTYICDCGLSIDRDLNAAVNIRKAFYVENSLEYSENNRGETVRPKNLLYRFEGSFVEVITESLF